MKYMADAKVLFRREGEIPGETEEKETPPASPAEENKDEEIVEEGSEGDKEGEDNVPFHKHPAWKRRDEEWKERLNAMESKHQDDLKAIREEFSSKREENSSQPPPSWWGGDEDQWKAYQKDRNREISLAEERAYARLSKEKKDEEERMRKATEHLRSEVSEIESDPVLNPSGKKINTDKLIKIAMDNDLVDSKGQWNYRAAARLMANQAEPVKKVPDARKALGAAGAAGGQRAGQDKTKDYTTAEDFRKGRRPW